MRTRIKFCGITSVADALAAAAMGVDALGCVISPSPRQVSPPIVRSIISKLPPMVASIGVFVNESDAYVKETAEFCRFSAIQLQGNESLDGFSAYPIPIIKAYRVGDTPDSGQFELDERIRACLFDRYDKNAPGGTGECFDWNVLLGKAIPKPLILAGGLRPNNVARAIQLLHPYAVDVSSGIEIAKGIKDHGLMSEFVNQVQSADIQYSNDRRTSC